jgi:hypothetical protein
MYMWMEERERTGVHHNFAPICYLLGVNGIRVPNIYPTTFAPHVWHLGGKFEVNLPHHPNTPHSRSLGRTNGDVNKMLVAPLARLAQSSFVTSPATNFRPVTFSELARAARELLAS